ncbi:MAG: acyl-CoA carboxylase subunit beta, partial [Thermofilaceae archaeon]
MEVDIERKIQELREKREVAKIGGGVDEIKKQHERGKLTARERIELLLDPESFFEIGQFVTHRFTDFGLDRRKYYGDGVVTGYGTIEGRRVYIFSQDFTVLGGSLGEAHARKICEIMDYALETKAPIIGLIDSGGARIQEGPSHYGAIFYRNVLASGVIPQISAILGPCAGGAAYSPALTDFVFMVKGVSNMFITGPAVIKAVTGEDVTVEQLGGPSVHGRISGVAQFVTETEAECMQKIRKLLSFLPSNNTEEPPVVATGDDPNRMDEELNYLIPVNPKKPFDVKEIISKIVDNGDFFEVHEAFARNIVVGFARMDGRTIGIVANQPKFLAGSLDIDASVKASRFIGFCDAFNIPIVTLVDCPGYLPGVEQEHRG